MTQQDVVIFGVGSFAEFVAYLVDRDSPHRVVAFCCERDFKPPGLVDIRGTPVADFETLEAAYPPDSHAMMVAIGINAVRRMAFDRAGAKGYRFISLVSSMATCSEDLEFGRNVFVSEGSVIQPSVRIGDNTIVIGSTIGFAAVIGADSLISGTTIGPRVVVGRNSFVGMRSTVGPGVTIGEDNLVGMGCLIGRDTAGGEVFS